MRILAIDSTAPTVTAAVVRDGELEGMTTFYDVNTHSEMLLPAVEALLAQLSLTTDDVDAFACSAGPGSYTGLRIGAATIKGLAFGTGKPCIGVSALEALAENLAGEDGLICPVMNARRGQVYTALFRGINGVIERVSEDVCEMLTETLAKINALGGRARFVGDGYPLIENVPESIPVPYLLRRQNAYSVAKVALRKMENETATDTELTPIYLRKTQAEREREERLAQGEKHGNEENSDRI